MCNVHYPEPSFVLALCYLDPYTGAPSAVSLLSVLQKKLPISANLLFTLSACGVGVGVATKTVIICYICVFPCYRQLGRLLTKGGRGIFYVPNVSHFNI